MILILGTGRSGTTWLAKVFDSHPRTLYRHEPDLVRVNSDIPFDVENKQVPEYLDRAAAYLKELAGVRNIRTSGSLPIFRKSYRSLPGHLLFAGSVYSLRALSMVVGDRPFLQKVPIPDFISPADDGDVEIVLKSVVSLTRARLFMEADPTLKIFHIVRHPCGFVASHLRGIRLGKLRARGSIRALAKLPGAAAYGFSIERLQAMSMEEQQTCRWMIENHKILNDAKGHPNYKLVIYEELCCDPTNVSKDLFAAAGLAWNEQTAHFIRTVESYQGRHERYYQVIRSPRKAAFKWRQELSRESIDRILAVVRDSELARLYASKNLL